jgi:hypothetical protein
MGKQRKSKQGNRPARRRRSDREQPARRKTARPLDAGESRAAIGLTVAWMLSLLATLVAILGTVVAKLLVQGLEVPPDKFGVPALLPGLLQFTGIVTGTLCLLLTAVCYYVRKQAPPTAVMIFAVVAGLAAWALAAW